MNPIFCRPILSTSIWLLLAILAGAQDLSIAPDRPNGIYSSGDPVTWNAVWRGDAEAPSVHYALKSGGLKKIDEGDLIFRDKIAVLHSTFDAPNTQLLELNWEQDGKKRTAFAGAVAAPKEIKPAEGPPGDFDAFWRAKLDDLVQVPPNPQLEEAESGKPGVSYWKVTLDNVRGTHVRCQLARPTEGEKFPALLVLQYAGVYPLQKSWVTDRAAAGWLALDIEAHDVPINEPKSFYDEQSAGPLKNYWSIGNDDPDASYYLRMYLSCYQAAEYLIHRPDWNGETLVVMGTSQGGQQALMLAGLHPEKISACIAFLPAACDSLGPQIGRAAGFPSWYFKVGPNANAEKVRNASRYYDPINFARHIQCPVLCGLGLLDDTAPPASVLAAMNEIHSPKEVLILPNAGHQEERGSHQLYYKRAYNAWLPALKGGKPAAAQDSAPQRNRNFLPAHQALLQKAKAGGIDVYFEGDSITRRWNGNDYPKFQGSWKQNFFGWNAADFGWGGDTTANVLYRLYDGELDGVNPKVLVLMIGTNNVGNMPLKDDSTRVEETVQGIRAILDTIQVKAPNAKIVLMGITPRNDDPDHGTALMPTIDRINDRISKFADGNRIRYLNINGELADENGRLHEGMTEDRLHLSVKGYQVWADALKPILTEWLGPPAETDHAPPPTGVPAN
jgi:cephalosporin-C deacetylase